MAIWAECWAHYLDVLTGHRSALVYEMQPDFQWAVRPWWWRYFVPDGRTSSRKARS